MRLRLSRQQPGFIVSGIGHAAVLVAGLVAFSSTTPFADQQEAIAVDVVSDSSLRELTRGVPTEKKVAEKPKPVVDKQSEKVEEQPKPGEAPREAPAPPSRPQVAEAKEVEPAKPPPPPPPAPPQQAAPPKPQPAPVDETADKRAEEKPEPTKAEPAPQPPKRPETAEKPAERPPEPKKPEPKREDLAKLIENSKPEEKREPAKAQEPDRKFNPSDIRKLLESKEKPQNAAATGQEVNRTASLGTRTGNAAKLSPADADVLGGIVREQLAQCWSPPPGANPSVKPIVRMSLNQDGSLRADPVLSNASGDPAFRSIADSALRAVRRCAPFRIPPRFLPFYADWQEWNVILDPSEFLG